MWRCRDVFGPPVKQVSGNNPIAAEKGVQALHGSSAAWRWT
jgi:hypothetical protein